MSIWYCYECKIAYAPEPFCQRCGRWGVYYQPKWEFTMADEFKITKEDWEALVAALERMEDTIERIENTVDNIENSMPTQEESSE